MSASTGLRRVSVYADGAYADLALPATVPVAALIPAIIDAVAIRGVEAGRDLTATSYVLCDPTTGALDASRTLAQHDIRDGALLVVTRVADAGPAPRYDDAAQAVARSVGAITPAWSPRASRLAGAVAASWLAGVAGLVALPAAPLAPRLLLAATAAATVSLLALRLAQCGRVTLTAASSFAAFTACAALAAVVTPAPVHAIGALFAVAGLGWLQAAARLAMVAAGLSPPTPTIAGSDAAATQVGDKAIRGHEVLSGLITAGSGVAAIGAICGVLDVYHSGGPRWAGTGLTLATGIALLLRIRGHTDPVRVGALLAGGILSVSMVFVVVATTRPGIWWCAAALAATAGGLGFAVPALTRPLWVRRGAELLEWVTLAAVAPLACSLCGLYDALGGLGPW